MSAARQGRKTIHVVCDDTDVFVLLIHFYKTLQIINQKIMVPTSLNRTVANIGDTVKKHANIVQHILSLHSLIGCDTASTIYGIGKVKALKTLQKGIAPPMLVSQEKDMSTLVIEATQFIASCYGITQFYESMSDLRLKIWRSKPGHCSSKSKRSFWGWFYQGKVGKGRLFLNHPQKPTSF